MYPLIPLVKDIRGIDHESLWGILPNRTWDLNGWYGELTLPREILKWRVVTQLELCLRRTLFWQRERRVTASIPAKNRLKGLTRLSAAVPCNKDAQVIPVVYECLGDVLGECRVDCEIIP